MISLFYSNPKSNILSVYFLKKLSYRLILVFFPSNILRQFDMSYFLLFFVNFLQLFNCNELSDIYLFEVLMKFQSFLSKDNREIVVLKSGTLIEIWFLIRSLRDGQREITRIRLFQ